MLMGAVANRAGELFAGIVAEVPFVDVLNTMLDDTLPLTPPEWPNGVTRSRVKRISAPSCPTRPNDMSQRRTIGDPRDGRPGRSARHLLGSRPKWIARLARTMSGGGPVLLRTNMGAGHGGASGRFHRLDEVAIAYAFATLGGRLG